MYQYKLSFKLNQYQQQASQQLVTNYLNDENTILEAVCGAGKTEMLLELIKLVLNKNLRVGFAIPRKTLVFEIQERLASYFNEQSFGIVCGDVKTNLDARLIFLTTHQLYRYPQEFDLLIIDEVDAFPYEGNKELENHAFNSARIFVLVSATLPLKYLKMNFNNIQVFKRHHLQKIPLPQFQYMLPMTQQYMLKKTLKSLHHQPLIIFVPYIKQGYQLQLLLRKWHYQVSFIYSKNLTPQVLETFKQQDHGILISSTVLERGITLKKLNVIVYNVHETIFTSDTLIQICGRVGRDSIHYQGQIIMLGQYKSKSLKACLKILKKHNEDN
ncbi:MAG: DEAD/DEAH box helicase family protein [Bacilli bacterium]